MCFRRIILVTAKGIYQKRVKVKAGRKIENIKDVQVKQNGATPSGQESVAGTEFTFLLEATEEWKGIHETTFPTSYTKDSNS